MTSYRKRISAKFLTLTLCTTSLAPQKMSIQQPFSEQEISIFNLVWNWTMVMWAAKKNRIKSFRLKFHIHIQVSVQLFRKFGSTFRPFLFKIEQDMCMFAMGTYSREAVMLKRVLNISTQKINGNFYDPCPLTVGFAGLISSKTLFLTNGLM